MSAFFFSPLVTKTDRWIRTLRIITVIMSPLLRIITRSIIRNNGVIIMYHRPGQLGDLVLVRSNHSCQISSINENLPQNIS